VRLPRQPGGGASIEKEEAWLPHVARRVTAGVPAVVGVGDPALGYPERWAITTWLPGTRPSVAHPGARVHGRAGLATGLARFVTELRAMELPEGSRHDESLSSYRGLLLGELDADFRETVDQCRGLGLDLDLDLDAALRVWELAVDASEATEPVSTWYHGDLLLENLLLDDAGDLSAVLDFGGLAVGNPTVDLVVAWEVLDDEGRRVLRRALDIDDATWTASRGWALLIAMITFPYYGATMPARCADRLTMVKAAINGT
jgi:aminoglycoside phosphotransferase (APT) family kinase protein